MLGVKRLKDMKKGLYQPNPNAAVPTPAPVPTSASHRLPPPSTPSRQSAGLNNDRRPNVPIRQTKSTLERCNSLENNSIQPPPLTVRKYVERDRHSRPQLSHSFSRQPTHHSHRSPTRTTANGDSSNYATLRKPPMSPKTAMNKPQPQPLSHQRIASNLSPSATSSFRLPPPLSSSLNPSNSSPNHESLSSSRARSLENINANDKPPFSSPSAPVDTNHSHINNGYSVKHTESVSSQYAHRSTKMSNLQVLDDANLSSSTESTNGIPFANENIGTIKQRSPHNHNGTLYNTPVNTMKRSLPVQFFEQSTAHLLKTSYPMSTAIYDNNERVIPSSPLSPGKQLRKTPTQVIGRISSSITGEKHLPYLEMMKHEKQTKIVK